MTLFGVAPRFRNHVKKCPKGFNGLSAMPFGMFIGYFEVKLMKARLDEYG